MIVSPSYRNFIELVNYKHVEAHNPESFVLSGSRIGISILSVSECKIDDQGKYYKS